MNSWSRSRYPDFMDEGQGYGGFYQDYLVTNELELSLKVVSPQLPTLLLASSLTFLIVVMMLLSLSHGSDTSRHSPSMVSFSPCNNQNLLEGWGPVFFLLHPVSFLIKNRAHPLLPSVTVGEDCSVGRRQIFNKNSFYMETTEIFYLPDTVSCITDQVFLFDWWSASLELTLNPMSPYKCIGL